MRSLKEIQRNRIYLIEKENHDKYCDGEGSILKFNAFTGHRIDEDCPFCKRLTSYRLRKHLERTERYGDQEATDTTTSDEDSETNEGL